MLALIHVFLDNARYHHAKLVHDWLSRPGCRIRLHFVPAYCPHLNPIERLWGVMHKHVTHNELRVSAARSRRGSSVGRTRDVGGEWSTMEISPGRLGGAGGDHRLASAV